jgi:hypothetical protein
VHRGKITICPAAVGFATVAQITHGTEASTRVSTTTEAVEPAADHTWTVL